MNEDKLRERVSLRYVRRLEKRQSAARPRSARRRRRLLTLLVVAVAALAGAIVVRTDSAAARAQVYWGALRSGLGEIVAGIPVRRGNAAEGDSAPLAASGIVQVEEVSLASEYGGRIAAIPVGRGEFVAAGEVLVRLDTTLLDAQIRAAEAAIAMAEAGLAQAKAGARPGQIAVAKAQLAQAEAARRAATQAISDTMALVDNPQHIRLQIAVTQAQAEVATYRVAQALALKDAAEIGKDKFKEAKKAVREAGGEGNRRFKVKVASGSLDQLWEKIPPELRDILPEVPEGTYTWRDLELHIQGGFYELYKWVTVNIHIPFEMHLMPNKWWQAWVGVNAAAAEKEGVEASLAHLYAQKAHPQDLEAKADEAVAALAQAEARAVAALAHVDGLKAGATQEQVAALEARVAQAQAVLDSLLSQRAMMEISSPMDGVVVDVVAHQGEVAAPGATLLTVADLTDVRLTVYLPETRISRVRLGQDVRVTVDSFPDRVFDGQVTHIADHAEFTPRNVATSEERINLVFAVEIRLPNDDRALKPGMPTDTVFGE